MPQAEGGRRTHGRIAAGTRELPLVSIITVVYNGEAHVEECLSAVAAQTYPNVEHIVIDGGSTDGTLDILRRHDETLGYWMSDPDHGLYDAMNKGVALVADAESYVLFANADDHLHKPDVIERVIAASAGADLVYGRMELTDGGIYGEMGREVSFTDLAQETLCHPATFVRRKVFDQIGTFDTRYTIAADYDFIVRAFASGIRTRFVDVVVSTMRMGGLSDDRFMLSCSERKAVIRSRFPLLPRITGVAHVNFYDIPRNVARRSLDRMGLLGFWRSLKNRVGSGVTAH